MMTLAAVLCGVAVLVWCGPGPSLARLAEAAPSRPRRASTRLLWLLPPLAGLVLWGASGLAWLAAASIAAGTVGWLVQRVGRARQVRRGQQETARSILGLALLLRSGRIPTVALEEVAEDCPALAPVVATARLGGDVPEALAVVSASPGREGFRQLGAAWRVAERLGAPVASVLTQVAEALRAEQELQGVVASELAMARNSARVLAVLPFGALGLGFLAGANPVAFLVGNPAGCWLVLLAVGLAATGLVWTERMGGNA
ncbi:MAG: type II secretion system F family protein [Propionibacteriaceae bacterium]|nr:type II secretion system F family protein [Propionibacteriaceae bacterium]